MKRLIVVMLFAFISVVLPRNFYSQVPDNKNIVQDTTKHKTKLYGYIFTKLGRINTRSEGLEYYIQLENYKEIHINKKAALFHDDETLNKFVGKKVKIEGEFNGTVIVYKTIVEDNRLGM